jgi:hypothetical protein
LANCIKNDLFVMLNIVEPTLNSYTGHCYSLVEAIAQAVPTGQVRVWAGTQCEEFWKTTGQIKPYFFRPLRKIQSFFLFRQLLREPGKILLSTAGSIDFVLLNWGAQGEIPVDKVYLYVHWLGTKASISSKLIKVAQRQPNLEVLCTTERTTDFFKNLGFRATTVAYPRLINFPPPQLQAFHHLLVAGAARMDKGFNRIVDLVDELAQTQASWPICIQTSTTHQAKHGADILFQVERLQRSGYMHLSLIDTTLNPQEYQALFAGGISIQPYSGADFEDRVSGVALDALTAGCPVIVTANTWLSRIVLKHNAGIATSDLSPSGLRKAIAHILQDYDGYSLRAAKAGIVLRQEHSASSMMRIIFKNHNV